MRIANITIDCLDARELANWYVDLLAGKVTQDFGEYLFVEAAGLSLGFQQETEVQPGKNRLHIDFESSDYDADVQRCLDRGATKIAENEVPGLVWTTFADPAGNLFDVSRG
jgi:predicted enzyme related to lactoylglutathione lyase